MIEKEFVPYQESLELKELGFDEPCISTYRWGSKEPDQFSYLWQTNKDRFSQLHSNSPLIQYGFGAPLYQQAFRWFRDKGFLISFSSHDKDTHEFYIKWISTKSILSNEYKTYEEAELECLRQLIKITKQSLYSIPIYENNIKTEHSGWYYW